MLESDYLTMKQAAHVLGRKMHPASVTRWARKGVKARSGALVRLQHLRIGGLLYTKREWLEEFGRTLAEADLAAADVRHPSRLAVPPPVPGLMSHTDADAALRRAGL